MGCSGKMRWKSPSNNQPSTDVNRPRSGGNPGQCIELTQRPLLPIDVRAESELD